MAYYIGIEIEDAKIRIIEVQRSWKKYTVTNKIEIPLTSELLDKGALLDEQGIYKVVKEALTHSEFKGKRAYVLLNQHFVMRWAIEVPCCLEKELTTFLEINEKQYLPISLKDYSVNCQRIERKTNSKDIGHFMVVGAHYHYLNGVIKLLENMKFIPVMMTSMVDLIPEHKGLLTPGTSYGVLYEKDRAFVIALYENNLCTVSRVFDKNTLMTLWNIEEEVQNGWYEVLGWEIHKLIAFYNEEQPNSQITHLYTHWKEELEEVDDYFRELLGIEVTFSRPMESTFKLLNEDPKYNDLVRLVMMAMEGA